MEEKTLLQTPLFMPGMGRHWWSCASYITIQEMRAEPGHLSDEWTSLDNLLSANGGSSKTSLSHLDCKFVVVAQSLQTFIILLTECYMFSLLYCYITIIGCQDVWKTSFKASCAKQCWCYPFTICHHPLRFPVVFPEEGLTKCSAISSWQSRAGLCTTILIVHSNYSRQPSLT